MGTLDLGAVGINPNESSNVENIYKQNDNFSTQEINLCIVCEAPTRSYCKACCNAYYCCREHQKAHWKIHKPECHPVKVIRSPTSNGIRTLIATRVIKQGEIFLEEFPIFITPNTRFENGITCLGCCKKLTAAKSVSCIRCGWPLCSIQCPMENMHSDNECVIFQQQEIQPPSGNLGSTHQTLCEIGVLRMLLERKRDVKKWGKLLEQDSFKSARETIPDQMFSVASIVRFIKEQCELRDIEDDLVDTAFGILRGNSFDTSDYSGFIQACPEDIRCASLIFPRAIIPGLNCIPNASYSIRGQENGSFKIVCFATVEISKNEPISIPYEEDITGAFLRRKVKETVFFQNCKCKLCADPTEFGTFISSPKCKDCKSGYYLSIDSLSQNSEWKCNNCPSVINQLQILDILQSARLKLQNCILQSKLEDSLKSIKNISESILHPNHFLILQTEMEICRRVLAVIGIYEIKNIQEDVSIMMNNLVEITKHLLSMANILRPGYSRIRSRLLYSLQFGLLVSLLNEQGQQSSEQNASDAMQRKKQKVIEQVSQIQKEAETILALETDENSEEFFMLKTLRGELKMAVKTIH